MATSLGKGKFWIQACNTPLKNWPNVTFCSWGGVDEYKSANLAEGNQKAPFSIATIPRCREGATPFPGLVHFTLDPYLIMPSVKQGGIKYHILSLWYDLTWDWTLVFHDYKLLILGWNTWSYITVSKQMIIKDK